MNVPRLNFNPVFHMIFRHFANPRFSRSISQNQFDIAEFLAIVENESALTHKPRLIPHTHSYYHPTTMVHPPIPFSPPPILNQISPKQNPIFLKQVPAQTDRKTILNIASSSPAHTHTPPSFCEPFPSPFAFLSPFSSPTPGGEPSGG